MVEHIFTQLHIVCNEIALSLPSIMTSYLVLGAFMWGEKWARVQKPGIHFSFVQVSSYICQTFFITSLH